MPDDRPSDREPAVRPATKPAEPPAVLREDELKKVQGGVSEIVITKSTDKSSTN